MKIRYNRYIPAHWVREKAEVEPLSYSELRNMKIGREVFAYHDGEYKPAKITEHDIGKYKVQGEARMWECLFMGQRDIFDHKMRKQACFEL